MRCPGCGKINDEFVKFCIECGYKLQKNCPKCNNIISIEDRFCIYCGYDTSLKSETKEQPIRSKKKKHTRKSGVSKPFIMSRKSELLLYGSLGLFFLILIFLAINDKQKRNRVDTPRINILEMNDKDPLVEANLLEIASRYRCPCGSCGDEPLIECQCETALQLKQFIRESLKQDTPKEQIFAGILRQYPNIKVIEK